jgi:hypothetical protein
MNWWETEGAHMEEYEELPYQPSHIPPWPARCFAAFALLMIILVGLLCYAIALHEGAI